MTGESGSRVNEPPAQVTPGGIEPRPRLAGYSALDLIIAGSAILISCISLFIAVQQSRTMEKTLAAGSWPLLQFASGNTNDQGKLSISMQMENQGVGPAIIRRFRMIYGGKEYDNLYALMHDCCGYVISQVNAAQKQAGQKQAGTPLTQPIEGTVIKGGDKTVFFSMDLTEANASSWRKLDAARFKLRFDACYCSVLGDCWQSDLSSFDQKKVAECPLPAGRAKR